MSRYLLISSDCHAGATPATFREYLDAEYRGVYDELLARPELLRRRVAETVGLNPDRALPGESLSEDFPACWSAERRLAELEKDGIENHG